MWLSQCGSFSYAFPGTILSLGVLWLLSSIDNVIDHWMREWFGITSSLLFTGTAFVLVSRYVIHFLEVPYGSVDTGFQRIHKALGRFPKILGKKLHFTLVPIYPP